MLVSHEKKSFSNQKSLLLEETIRQMMSFQPSQSEFDSIKAQFLQDYKTKIQNPEDLSEDLKMSFLKSTNFPLIERIKALESVTLYELIEFVKSYRKRLI